MVTQVDSITHVGDVVGSHGIESATMVAKQSLLVNNGPLTQGDKSIKIKISTDILTIDLDSSELSLKFVYAYI